MQDPRLRLFSVMVLSITAFSGVVGALLAFLWWLVFSGGPILLKRSWWPLFAFIPLLLVTAALWITGDDWLPYLLRLGVVILIAIFAYQDQKPWEFIQVCAWAFGSRTGFDMGLAGEMGFGSVRYLEEEVRRVRQTYLLKGIPVGVRTLLPISSGLVFGLLRRAEEQADLLLARGYDRGGMACPRFSTPRADSVAAITAIFACILAFMPVREFFILIQ
ncbi:MAG: energy-coupling factor transporter transmembrane protein EcfT [Methanolinea sp.]|jgi:energy-coupling factor transport system permease protein|nr:energy-coupling factor transporter transmembrane protein EcfT [Methanolinea sp.]